MAPTVGCGIQPVSKGVGRTEAPSDPDRSTQGLWRGQPISRRRLLHEAIVAGVGLTGLGLVGCGGPTAARHAGAAPAVSRPEAYHMPADWTALVQAAQREGTVSVFGAPDPHARQAVPAAFKQRFGIDVAYTGGNSGQLAARVARERVAGEYTVDVTLTGSDTVDYVFLPDGWLDPLKPALIMPGVTDPTGWKTGGPWFRDPHKNTVLQIFNTVTPVVTVNTGQVQPGEISDAQALLDPRWRGRIAAFDPSIGSIGSAVGSAIYVSQGKAYVEKLYKGQRLTLTQNYQQIADWVAHGEYPIAIAAAYGNVVSYLKAGIPLKQFTPRGIREVTGGGFGLVCLWNHAPHPNAARVFANWIASPEGVRIYGQAERQAPVRSDVSPTWLPADLVPVPGAAVLDTYDYTFEMQQNRSIRAYFAKLLK